MATTTDRLLRALTHAVNALLDREIRFAVAGGCAAYARGGPASDHDVDLFVKPADVDRSRRALAEAGLRLVDPPEDWLTKAYDDDILVDVIFRPNYRTVTDELLDRARWMRIGPTAAPVVSGTDLMIDKIMVLDPHRLDLTGLLHIARGLREQVDWPRVRVETAMSPYARAFLGLLDDLAITDKGGTMIDDPDDILPQYLVANLRRAFAEDPRTAELGVHVTIRSDVVVLSGEVGSAQRRRQLAEVVHEHVPTLRVHNDVRVTSCAVPDTCEQLEATVKHAAPQEHP